MKLPHITPGPWKIIQDHYGKPEYKTVWMLDSPTRGGMAKLEVLDLSDWAKRPENKGAEKLREQAETMLEVGANARAISALPELLAAFNDLLNRYLELVNSGDAGHWNPEEETEIRNARAALLKAGCVED